MEMQDFDPPAGEAQATAPGLRRVLAPNPSPMTFRGTNTYLLGAAELCVIDPGPDDPRHLAALLAAIGTAPVRAIVVTHSHLDHSPLARPLAEATGAPVLGYGDSLSGRSAVMQGLAAAGMTGGGEGVDPGFRPDRCLADGELLAGRDWEIRAIHTPGHLGNHLCLRWGEAIFTGDHAMGWASSLVSPPDGDMGDYLRSCARLQREGAGVLYPGHGPDVTDPAARLAWLVAHRHEREAQIRAVLARGPATPAEVARAVYPDLAPGLLPAAERNVLAHLIDLAARGEAEAHPSAGPDATFTPPPPRAAGKR